MRITSKIQQNIEKKWKINSKIIYKYRQKNVTTVWIDKTTELSQKYDIKSIQKTEDHFNKHYNIGKKVYKSNPSKLRHNVEQKNNKTTV